MIGPARKDSPRNRAIGYSQPPAGIAPRKAEGASGPV